MGRGGARGGARSRIGRGLGARSGGDPPPHRRARRRPDRTEARASRRPWPHGPAAAGRGRRYASWDRKLGRKGGCGGGSPGGRVSRRTRRPDGGAPSLLWGFELFWLAPHAAKSLQSPPGSARRGAAKRALGEVRMATQTDRRTALETFATEGRSFPPPKEFAAKANVRDPKIYERADRDFEGFWAEALAGRINDSEAKVLVTADGGYRKGNVVPLKKNADDAVAQTTTIEKVLVVKRTKQDVPWTSGRDMWWHEIVDRQKSECPAESLDSEHMLYLLYTSGTTAKPKGIVHTTAGYLAGVAATHKMIFDVKDDDVYWCAADIGWVTGHSYIVFAPLANG